MCVCECVIVLRGIRGWWVVRVCVCVGVGGWGYLEYVPCFSNKPPAWCHCSPAWEEIRTGRAVVWAPIETQCASKPPRSPQQNLKMHTHTHTHSTTTTHVHLHMHLHTQAAKAAPNEVMLWLQMQEHRQRVGNMRWKERAGEKGKGENNKY